jgi:hypothetical protein
LIVSMSLPSGELFPKTIFVPSGDQRRSKQLIRSGSSFAPPPPQARP